MKVLSYKMASKGGKALALALGIKRLSHKAGEWRNNFDELVVNWGTSTERLPAHLANRRIRWLNKPEAVSMAADKLSSFRAMADYGVSTVPFTTDYREAQGWLDNGPVVVRHKLRGNSGEGIELLKEGGIPLAPLYTKYVPKKQEYRIHVFQGNVIIKQRKARNKAVADGEVNWQIRNHGNGFIFARNEEGDEIPEGVISESIRAVTAHGLDFGACDVGWNAHEEKAYVYEVNTACGLEGSTLQDYVEAIKAV